MAAQQNFRSAFNGFNREDVVHYIEYLNAKHTAELNQLKSEVEYLQSRLSQEPADTQDSRAVIQELTDRNRALEEELETLRAGQTQEPDASVLEELTAVTAERDALAAQLDAVTSERNGIATELDGVLQKQHDCKSRMEDELAAYRRAERAERLALERVNKMYLQANGIIANATVKVDEAAAQISEMSETVMAQLEQLKLAVSGSNTALKDAAATMYAIRPEDGE